VWTGNLVRVGARGAGAVQPGHGGGGAGGAKEPLMNLEADSVEQLRRAVRASFRRLGRDKAALRGFFRHAGLTLN
jgi:hypothetical protein